MLKRGGVRERKEYVFDKTYRRHTDRSRCEQRRWRRYQDWMTPRVTLASWRRRDTRTQLSMRASTSSPNSCRSCALGSTSPLMLPDPPLPGMTSLGRMGFFCARGPRESLKDCLRRAQRESVSSSLLLITVRALRRCVRTAPADDGTEGELACCEKSSVSSFFTRGASPSETQVVELSEDEFEGAEALLMSVLGAESVVVDCWVSAEPSSLSVGCEGPKSRGPCTTASSRDARVRCTQERSCW